MSCVALFCGGPYWDVRTKDCLGFLDLAPKEITCRWDDGRFERYRVPAHDFTKSQEPDSDGASLPTIARVLRPSLRERMFGAARVHDAIFHRQLEVWRDGVWVNLFQAVPDFSLTDANELLEALMFIEETTAAERLLVYEALQWFGSKAWNEDAKAAK